MNFLSNIVMNLHATGPAAVACTWLLAITALGLFGQGDLASKVCCVGLTAMEEFIQRH